MTRGRPSKRTLKARKTRREVQRKALEQRFTRRIAAVKGHETRKLRTARGVRRTKIRKETRRKILSLEKEKRSSIRSLSKVQKKRSSLKPKGKSRKVRVEQRIRRKKPKVLARKAPPGTKPKVLRKQIPLTPPPVGQAEEQGAREEKVFSRTIDVSDIAKTAKDLEREGKLGEARYRDSRSGLPLTQESNDKVSKALAESLPEKFQKAAETIALFGGPNEQKGKKILADWYLDYLKAPDDDKPDWPEEMTGWT